MSLRINRGSQLEGVPGAAEPADNWGARVAKLIPAEALGFYGTAVGMVSTWQSGTFALRPTLVAIALVGCVLIFVVRYRATKSSGGGAPQLMAISISLVSFMIWLAALAATGDGMSPFPQAWAAPYAPLAALIWGTLVPYFYKGD